LVPVLDDGVLVVAAGEPLGFTVVVLVVVVFVVTDEPPFIAAIIESALNCAIAVIRESFWRIISSLISSTRALTAESIWTCDMSLSWVSVVHDASEIKPPAINKSACFFIRFGFGAKIYSSTI
jgi:hypothetical protein